MELCRPSRRQKGPQKTELEFVAYLANLGCFYQAGKVKVRVWELRKGMLESCYRLWLNGMIYSQDKNANVSPLREKGVLTSLQYATKKKVLLLSPVSVIGTGSKDAVTLVIPWDPAHLQTHWKTITVWYELFYSDWRLCRDKNLSLVGNNHVSFFFLATLSGRPWYFSLLTQETSLHNCYICPHRQTFT